MGSKSVVSSTWSKADNEALLQGFATQESAKFVLCTCPTLIPVAMYNRGRDFIRRFLAPARHRRNKYTNFIAPFDHLCILVLALVKVPVASAVFVRLRRPNVSFELLSLDNPSIHISTGRE